MQPRNTASTPRKNKLKNEEVRKKYDIQYLTGEKDWQDFDELFSSVSHLGTKNYNKWKRKEESSKSTWKVDIRERADNLVRESALIQKSQFEKPEAAWRTLENYIFEHLRWSSTCENCGRRAWRAATPVDTKTLAVDTNLMTRQSKRRPCLYCDKKHTKPSMFEGDQEERFDFSDEQQEDMGKYRRPDYIFRLKRIGTVKKYLNAAIQNSQQLSDVPLWPTQYGGAIFPFLLCEAKSAKADVSQLSVEHQLAISTRQALLAQKALALGPDGEDGDKLGFEPLAWCVTYRGPECTLSAARLKYRCQDDGTMGYGMDIFRLWSGHLCEPNNALQLLLIVDYIADWARDIYRENVIQQLKAFGTPEGQRTRQPSPARSNTSTVRSLRPLESKLPRLRSSVPRLRNTKPSKHNRSEYNKESSDIYSTADTVGNNKNYVETAPFIHVNSWRQKVGSMQQEDAGVEDTLRKLDVQSYAFRDARVFRSRVIGLSITLDTIDAFKKSAANEKSATDRFRRIALNLGRHDPLYMAGAMIVAMEKAWVGAGSKPIQFPISDLQKKFYVLCTFSTYVSPDWEQTRELCYLAVRMDTVNEVIKLGRSPVKLFRTEVTKPDIEALFYLISNVSVRAHLAACLDRCTMMPSFCGAYSTVKGQPNVLKNNFNLAELVWQRRIPKPYRNMVWRLYKTKYLGQHEVESPYLRSHDELLESQSFRSQLLPKQTPWSIREGGSSEKFIPCDLDNNDELFLCYDSNKRGLIEECTPEWCLFFLDRSRLQVPINPSAYKAHLFHVAYKTQRIGRGTIWRVDDWNTRLAMPKRFDIQQIGKYCYRAFKKSVEQNYTYISQEDGTSDIGARLSQLHLQSPKHQVRSRSASRSSFTYCADDNDGDKTRESVVGYVLEHEEGTDDDSSGWGYESSTDISDEAQSLEYITSDDEEDDEEEDDDEEDDDEENDDEVDHDEEDDGEVDDEDGDEEEGEEEMEEEEEEEEEY